MHCSKIVGDDLDTDCSSSRVDEERHPDGEVYTVECHNSHTFPQTFRLVIGPQIGNDHDRRGDTRVFLKMGRL